MENSKLTFLDTSVVQNGDFLHLEQFRKSNYSDCLVNYKNSITPKSYKISALVGKLYRANNTTTTTEALDSALKTTKDIFIKNKFPPKLIDQKIANLKSKNFQASDSKERRRLEFENPDFDHHTISLPFSSHRCSQVASQIYTIIKRYTPYYKLNIVFTTIKLESIILSRLKPKNSTTTIRIVLTSLSAYAILIIKVKPAKFYTAESNNIKDSRNHTLTNTF